MKNTSISLLLVLSLVISGLIIPRIATADRNMAVITKSGSYKLSDDTQTFAGKTNFFDDSSDSAFSGEFEWRTAGNISFGGEILVYSHDFTGGGSNGTADTVIVTANIKKYFKASNTIYPFIGFGIGGVVTSLREEFIGSGSGAATQFMAGMQIRGRRVGFHIEYKLINAKPEDIFDEPIDVSGSGIFAGLSIHF